MKKNRPLYRKNHPLVFVFIGMLTLSLLAGLYVQYRITERLVDNQFRLSKSSVLDSTLQGYNTLIQDSIPSISAHAGHLDSASFEQIARRYFLKFPFIEDIIFYKVEISNTPDIRSIRVQNLRFTFLTIIKYIRDPNKIAVGLFQRKLRSDFPEDSLIARCYEPVYSFVNLIRNPDNSILSQANTGNKLFRVSERNLSYMSIPEIKEINNYRDLMYQEGTLRSKASEKDLIFFDLNPAGIQVVNTSARLFENISIRQINFDSLAGNKSFITAGLSLPRSFRERKIYFISSRKFLESKIISSFIPSAGILLVIYTLTLLIAFLIFRNLNINSVLFKLQYDFINNFTHEFKTPVSVIKIVGSNIQSGEFMSNSELLHYGNIIDEEAEKLDKLMNRLLSFTQLENRSIPLKREEINMESFCGELVNAYQIKFPDFLITCHIENIVYFNTDKILLYSLFTNLADNAYRYSNTNQKELKIILKKSNHNLHISFIDKGIGISQNQVKHIFNKFYKIENEFNQQGSVGIGLAFCKEIIQFMHGEMVVNSRLGKGTEFYIKLPILD